MLFQDFMSIKSVLPDEYVSSMAQECGFISSGNDGFNNSSEEFLEKIPKIIKITSRAISHLGELI